MIRLILVAALVFMVEGLHSNRGFHLVKFALATVSFIIAIVAGVSWGRAPLMELTGWGAGTVSVVIAVAAGVLLLFAGLGLASYRAKGKRGGAFVAVLVASGVLLSGGFAFATPSWQSELQKTIALAGPSSFFDEGEATCQANAKQFANTMADMTMANWRETNEVLTNESAAIMGIGALSATHFGSVIVDIFVAAITDQPDSVRIYGDAKDLAKKWELDDSKSTNTKVIEDGREFFDEVLDHIEEEHSEGLAKLAKLKNALKKEGNWKVQDLKLVAQKDGDRWLLKNADPNVQDDEPLVCVREDGRWRLDLAGEMKKKK